MQGPRTEAIENEDWVLAEIPLGNDDDEVPSHNGPLRVAVENPPEQKLMLVPPVEPTECSDSSTESRASNEAVGPAGDFTSEQQPSSTELSTDDDDANNNANTKASRKWFLKAKSILEDTNNDGDDDDDARSDKEGEQSTPYCNSAMAELMAEKSSSEVPSSDDKKEAWSLRKAGVAVAGGSLVGIGAVLVPMPVPLGVLTMAAGMGVLGTEFPKAQEALDSTRDKLAKFAVTDETGDDNKKDSKESPPIEETEGKEKTPEPEKFHQIAARTFRKQASSLKASFIQPLAGKTVAVYDQLKATTKNASSNKQEGLSGGEVVISTEQVVATKTDNNAPVSSL